MRVKEFLYRDEKGDHPVHMAYKRVRNFNFRMAKDGWSVNASCPYYSTDESVERAIREVVPRLLRRAKPKPLPYSEDGYYRFGEFVGDPSFFSLDPKAREKTIKKELLPYVERKVRELEPLMGVKRPYKVRVRKMTSRYGVNSEKTHSVTFSTVLYHYPPEVIDSVVVHELAHDFRRDHSKAFYRIVLRYCPDYWALHDKLRKCEYADDNNEQV